MDAQLFLSNFSHFANAPGGVSRLRQMIYHLATTGLLLASTGHEADVDTLLLELASKRERLIREKRYKRILELEGEAIRIPDRVRLPGSWRWTRLLDIGEINPRNEAEDDQPAAFLPMSGVSELHSGEIRPEVRRWEEIKKGFTHFGNGDVVIAKITPCFENGKSAVISDLPCTSGIGAGTTELHVFRPIHPGILPEYVYLYLRSPLFMSDGKQNMTGTAGQKRLPTSYFATRAFPLPPTEEQKQVAAKVDELMVLCDKLEAQQQDRLRVRAALRQTAFEELGAAASPREMHDSWSRLSNTLGTLLCGVDDVADLRQLVLDLAIKGRLTEKHTTDEPVLHLVNRSIQAKAARLASGAMKRKTASSTDVIQFDEELPVHWQGAPLEQLFQFIDYRGKTPIKTNRGVVLVTAKNVRPGQLNRDPIEYISEDSYSKWMTRGFPKTGDLLFTTEAPLGNVARIESQPDFALAQRIIDLQPFVNLNTQCAMYFMMSPTFQAVLERNSNGMTARGIKAAKLKQLILPIPPVEEQARIVKKVDELFGLCNELEIQLRNERELIEKCGSAAVSSLTGITVTQESEVHVKVPKTELIAHLLIGTYPDVNAHSPLATILSRHSGEMSANDLRQRYGTDDIEAFYSQLKVEVAHGWILEPAPAAMRELVAPTEK